MKKGISLCLILAMLMLCVGCSAQPAETTLATTTTAAPTTETMPLEEGIRNIILIIGDGMGDEHIEAGALMSGKTPPYADWAHTHANTNSLDAEGNATVTTDSAAAATALATGMLTTNGKVGMDGGGNTTYKTILDYANEMGKSTGVVTTDLLTGATPGGFSGHATDRNDEEGIRNTQLYSGIKLLCGSYTNTYKTYKDAIETAGYTVSTSLNEAAKHMDAEMAYWQLSEKLETITPKALEYLAQDRDGFVVMIEQAHVDKYSHSNNFGQMHLCVNSLNNTVQAVLDWAQGRDDTVVIITADHETGGLSVGQEGDFLQTETTADGKTISYAFSSDGHTNSPVSVYCWGFQPDFAKYAMDGDPALIKNTAVFQMMLDILQE